jgi:hypothetical protein
MEIVLIPNNAGTFKKNFVEPGRNKPCHCGSGRKYKHCCLDKNYAVVREKCAAASKKNMGATLPPAAEAPRSPAPEDNKPAGAAQGALSKVKNRLFLHLTKRKP